MHLRRGLQTMQGRLIINEIGIRLGPRTTGQTWHDRRNTIVIAVINMIRLLLLDPLHLFQYLCRIGDIAGYYRNGILHGSGGGTLLSYKGVRVIILSHTFPDHRLTNVPRCSHHNDRALFLFLCCLTIIHTIIHTVIHIVTIGGGWWW